MEKLFLKLNIRVKLAIVLVVATLLAALSVGYFSFLSARTVVQGDQRKTLAEITNLITMSIDNRVGALGRLMSQSADSRLIRDYAEQLDAPPGSELREYYDAMLNAFGHVNAVYVVNEDGLYTPNDAGHFSVAASDYSAIRDRVSRSPGSVIWEGVRPPLGPPGRWDRIIRALRGIYDDDERLIAVLVLELTEREFDNVLLSNRASLSYQYRMIFDRDRQLVAANRKLDDKTTALLHERFENGSRSFMVKSASVDYFVQGQYDGLTGWTVFSAQEVPTAFPSSSQLVRLILQFVLISSLLISISVVFLSATITKPVKSLAKAMKRFEKGDYSVRLNPRGKDEMGQLMHAFNYMADEIDTLIHRVYEVRLARQEAEIAALEAQINPHFLYNALDAIQWMLIGKAEHEIAEVVRSLGKILRYSVDRQQRFVTLENELQYVEHYLHIQKYRLEDRLAYEIEVDETLRAHIIPKLILQPLIENAIIHGVEGVPKAIITLVGSVEDDRLILTVRDYGKGMTPAELETVRMNLELDDETAHVGMRNVHRRLRLQFGDPYGLTVDAEPGRGCTVTISLPLMKKEPLPLVQIDPEE